MKKYPLRAQIYFLIAGLCITMLVGITLRFDGLKQQIITNLAGIQLLKLVSNQAQSHSLAFTNITDPGSLDDYSNTYEKLLEGELEDSNDFQGKYFILSLYNIASKNWLVAEELLSYYDRLRPDDSVGKYWLGYVYFRQNKIEEAKDLFAAGNAVGSLADVGNELYKSGYLAESSKYYNLAIRVGKEIVERQESIQMATNNSLARTMTTRNISNTKTIIGVSYSQLGEIYRNQKLAQQAILNYEEALNYYPDNLNYRYILSQLYIQEGEYGKAIEHLITINKFKPDSAEWIGALGEGYLAQGNVSEAEKTLLMALKAGNDKEKNDKYWHARSFYALGTIYCQRSDWEHCLIAFSKAVEYLGGIDPSWEYVFKISFQAATASNTNDPSIYIQIGDIYKNGGSYLNAYDIYRGAELLWPDNTEIKSRISSLPNIIQDSRTPMP